MALPLYNGLLGHKNASHLLNRALSVFTKSDIDRFANLNISDAIAEMFGEVELPMPPLDPSTGTTWVDLPSAESENDDKRQKYFTYWWLGQMAGVSIPSSANKYSFLARERIVFFLHTHFTTIQQVVNNSRALYFQNILFRHFAFDGSNDPLLNFKQLSKKICLDNAMMVLLDGRLNVKGRPNENFAREFLELFTIGKGLPGHIPDSTSEGDYGFFTEKDVQEAARVFSGYNFDERFQNIDPDTTIPRVIAKANVSGIVNQHDNTSKQFSFRFGNAIVEPDSTLMLDDKATEASMHNELDQLIELIYAQDETVKNICRKIYRFYVYHDISDVIENTIISAMAETFRTNDFKIEPVIKELLSSQHFYDSANSEISDNNYGGLIKSPLELTLGTLVFLEYEFPDLYTQPSAFYQKGETILKSMEEQGMNFLNPYDVAGYEAYFQFPLFNRNWISANSLTSRYKLIFDVLNTTNTKPEAIQIDLLKFVKNRFDAVANDPDTLIRALISYVFSMSMENVEITTERINYFKSQFFKLGTGLPQGPEVFWTFSYSNAELMPASKEDARGMLQDLFNAIMQSPEYQLF
jgi:uncharacterized protein (DUF1800 family)